MPAPLKVVIVLLALLPAVLLAALAMPRFADGAARDRAAPIPSNMIAGLQVDQAVYRNAERELSRADEHDGDAQIEAAEAALYAGASKVDVAKRIRSALRLSPASARGWMLLSEMSAATASNAGVQALVQSFVLAPYDFYLGGRRANDAAQQWNALDADTRTMAQRQTVFLWEQDDLHVYIRPLLMTPAGVALVNRAFAGRRDDLRAMNRWLAQDRLIHPTVERPWP